MDIRFLDAGQSGACSQNVRDQLIDGEVVFLMTETAASKFFDTSGEIDPCATGSSAGDALLRHPIRDWLSSGKECEISMEFSLSDEEALPPDYYTVFLTFCHGGGEERGGEAAALNMDVEVLMSNDVFMGYLSAGMSPLPWMYLFFMLLYMVGLGLWVWKGIRLARARVFMIHHLMTALLVVKVCSLFFQALELHELRLFGMHTFWALPNYVFGFLRGLGFFVVVALIGTGWSFLKPFLTDRDKYIFMVIIPIQVFSNLAAVFLDVSSPGERGWFMLADIFRLLDLVCCAAIVIPIMRQIQHLREGAEADGKIRVVIQKLIVFRRFYLVLFSYIYITRVLVLLLDATLQYSLVWVGEFVMESATLAFMVFMFYSFRPVPNNPHFKTASDDGDDEENIAELELELEELEEARPAIRTDQHVVKPIELQ